MITEEDLKTAGYKKYKIDDSYCDNTLWQKTIRSGNIKNYFLNVKIYSFPINDRDYRGVEFESRLYLEEGNTLVGDTGFTLKVHSTEHTTVAEAEAFYAKAYSVLNCVPDLHNND